MAETLTDLSDQLSETWTASRFFTSFCSDQEAWAQWISARNTYDDAGMAIEAYISLDGRTEAEQYLRLYGVMQALQLQNDSLEYIYRIIGSWVDLRPVNMSRRPVGKEVGTLRFRLAGHPSKGVAPSNVLKGELSRGRVVVYSCHLDTPHEHVDVVDLINRHRRDHEGLLRTLLERLIDAGTQR